MGALGVEKMCFSTTSWVESSWEKSQKAEVTPTLSSDDTPPRTAILSHIEQEMKLQAFKAERKRLMKKRGPILYL